MYKATFDRLAQHFSQEPFVSEFESSKEEYFFRTGKIFQDEPIFESRMTGFFEWFLFEKCLRDYGIPPIRLFQLEDFDSINDQELKILRSLEQSHHSLFYVLEQREETLEVLDWLNLKKWSLQDPHHYKMLGKGEVVDARLVEFESECWFTDSLWTHPLEAREILRKETEQMRSSFSREKTQDFLFSTAYWRTKHLRFDHVPIQQIYHAEQTPTMKEIHA